VAELPEADVQCKRGFSDGDHAGVALLKNMGNLSFSFALRQCSLIGGSSLVQRTKVIERPDISIESLWFLFCD
jgi:hypothetical protein